MDFNASISKLFSGVQNIFGKAKPSTQEITEASSIMTEHVMTMIADVRIANSNGGFDISEQTPFEASHAQSYREGIAESALHLMQMMSDIEECDAQLHGRLRIARDIFKTGIEETTAYIQKTDPNEELLDIDDVYQEFDEMINQLDPRPRAPVVPIHKGVDLEN